MKKLTIFYILLTIHLYGQVPDGTEIVKKSHCIMNIKNLEYEKKLTVVILEELKGFIVGDDFYCISKENKKVMNELQYILRIGEGMEQELVWNILPLSITKQDGYYKLTLYNVIKGFWLFPVKYEKFCSISIPYETYKLL